MTGDRSVGNLSDRAILDNFGHWFVRTPVTFNITIIMCYLYYLRLTFYNERAWIDFENSPVTPHGYPTRGYICRPMPMRLFRTINAPIVRARKQLYTTSALLSAKALLRMQDACRFSTVRSTVRLTFRPVFITVTVIRSVDFNTFYYYRETWFLTLYHRAPTPTYRLPTIHWTNRSPYCSSSLPRHPCCGRTIRSKFDILHIYLCFINYCLSAYIAIFSYCYIMFVIFIH